jgi:hypothetical protein
MVPMESRESLARLATPERRAKAALQANQARQVQPDRTASQEQMAKQDHLEAKVNPDRWDRRESPARRVQQANLAHQAQRDQVATRAPMASQVQQDLPDPLDLEAKLASPARTVHRDHPASPARTLSTARARREPLAHSPLRQQRHKPKHMADNNNVSTTTSNHTALLIHASKLLRNFTLVLPLLLCSFSLNSTVGKGFRYQKLLFQLVALQRQ